MEEEKNYYFTFGSGQEFDGCYVRIYGTLNSTRKKIFERYGEEWSFQYSEQEWIKDDISQAEIYGYTELKIK